MKPPVRPPRLRCGLFPSIYLSHLLVLPATFGLQRFLPPYPYFPALYVVSVRQVRGLPTASSRFHLTMDTLAVQLCASSLPTRTRVFHPLEPAHGGRTRKNRNLDTHCIKIAVLIWRKRWDSNPRAREGYLISSQARYDHFDTLPYNHFSICLINHLTNNFESNRPEKTPES